MQSSLNDNKSKNRPKKQSGGLLKGIGHMFRFGKHRKDVYPATTTEVISDYGGWSGNDSKSTINTTNPANSSVNTSSGSSNVVSVYNTSQQSQQSQQQPPQQHNISSQSQQMKQSVPPQYQPPPPVSNGIGSRIQQNEAFNFRYPHYDVRTSNYVNTNDLQQQMR